MSIVFGLIIFGIFCIVMMGIILYQINNRLYNINKLVQPIEKESTQELSEMWRNEMKDVNQDNVIDERIKDIKKSMSDIITNINELNAMNIFETKQSITNISNNLLDSLIPKIEEDDKQN